jgi:hypothetical protein
VLSDVGRLADDAEAWVDRHLEADGGLLVVLGNRTDVRYWNAGPLSRLVGGTIVAPFDRSDENKIRLAPVDSGHPVLSDLVVGERLMGDVRCRRGFQVDAPGAEVLLEFPGIGPALIARSARDRGGVAVLFTGVDPGWSDLARSGFLVPLLHRLAGHLGGTGHARHEALVGEDLFVALDPRAASGRVEALAPGGELLLPEAVSAGQHGYSLRNVRVPGVYRFSQAGQEVALGAVNVEARESDLAEATSSDIDQWMSSLDHRMVPPDGRLDQEILEARFGRELWRLFVYAALALIAIEMLVARTRMG